MNKSNEKFFVVNLNEYVRIDPAELINQNGKYYTNGANNEFFYKTENLFLSSPTNNSVIKRYTNLILGEGLTDLNGNDDALSKIFPKKEQKLFIQDYKIHGNAALRILYDYNNKIAKLKYIPTRCIAVGQEEDILDDPTFFFYSFDWNIYQYRPFPIPAFGTSSGEKTQEVAYLRSPSPQSIFSLPDWFPVFQHCAMEREISNFFLNHITTGFSGATVINVNQGATLEEGEDERIKKSIINKLSGTSGDRIIVSINDNPENSTKVENLTITDAYQQFDFVSKESRNNILMGHQVNDVGLFGLEQATGFSSDSEKMIQSRKDLYRNVINPIREEILDFLQELLPEFKLQFKDFEEFDEDPNSEEIELKLKKKEVTVDTYRIHQFIEKGEKIDLQKWKLVDIDDEHVIIDPLIIGADINLIDTGNPQPNAESYQDVDGIYKIRYRYDGSKSPEREFCQLMMAYNNYYRYEDIMDMKLSNPAFSPKGSIFGYDVSIWKGGVNCKHYWVREIFVNTERTRDVDPTDGQAIIISPNKMIKETGIVPEVMDPRMWIAPNDMPGKGRLN